jgi:hypothetical protein
VMQGRRMLETESRNASQFGAEGGEVALEFVQQTKAVRLQPSNSARGSEMGSVRARGVGRYVGTCQRNR